MCIAKVDLFLSPSFSFFFIFIFVLWMSNCSNIVCQKFLLTPLNCFCTFTKIQLVKYQLKKVQKLVNEFSKIAWHRINTQNQTLLCIYNWHVETEIASKKMKYLSINLVKLTGSISWKLLNANLKNKQKT